MNMDKIKDALKLGKHYRMERFSIFFSVFSVLMIVVVIFSLNVKMAKDDSAISENAVYTTSVKTSKTEVSGDVIDVYASKDKTKAFVLLHFEDVAKISTNAENYQMFLTAADVAQNPSTLKVEPGGSIYMFGSTGYMGIYLVNTQGFDEQVLDLVIRCNSEIVPSVEKDEPSEDKSFDKYDQFRLYFNPGGGKASEMACLDSDTAPTVTDLYNEGVVVPYEKTIRTALDDGLQTMKVDLAAIYEYESRLDTQGVTLPATPAIIDGDQILEDGDGNLSLKTSNVVAKGFNFDWRSGSVKEGYLDDLIGTSNMSYEQFFAEKNSEAADDKQFSTSNITWMMKDGTAVEDLQSGNVGESKDKYTKINSDIQLLTQAWNQFYKDKTTYQVTTLKTLLMLEFDLSDIDTASTINTSESVLISY